MRKKLLSMMLLVFVASGAALAQTRMVEKVTKSGDAIVIPYEKFVLPNGLTLIVHEDHSDPLVHVDVTYHVGSAREQIGKSGFAHFFEHMMFEGSDHVADKQHFKIVSEAGGNLNGSTNRDRTNYFETLPSNQLEKALWLEADRMGFLLDAVTQQKFEIQRATVKNERGQRYDNVPYGLTAETFSRNLYPYGHPYSWETIGYVEDLNRVDVNDLKNFFLRWYGPNNATLTIGGDVNTSQVVKMVEKYFGPIPRGPEVKPVVEPDVKLDGDRYVSYTDNYARLPLLAIVYPTVPDYTHDKAALECLAQLLGQGRSSLLYSSMVKKQQALQASCFSRLSELSGEFIFQFIPMPGKTLADMEKQFHATMDSFEKRGVTEEDLQKFKGSKEASIINSLQSVQGKVTQLAAFQTFTGNPNKIADLLASYSSLTTKDVMNAYDTYLKGKHAVILSVLPKGQEKMRAAEDNYKVDSTHYVAPEYGYKGLLYTKAKDTFNRAKMPVSGPSPLVKVPKFWRKDLPDGANVIGTENTEIPTVTFALTIPGGHLASANDLSKAGLAGFFADMMMEDTRDHTSEQFATELQKLGSTISVTSGVDGVTYTVQSLKKNFSKTMTLLQERLLRPEFTQAAFDRLKQQDMQMFKAQKGQPSTIADNVFAKLTYGPNNILGISEDGTEQTVTKLTLQDIKDYYQNYMTSVGAKVVVVGDITEGDVLPQLAFLNKLPKKKIDLPKPVVNATIDKTKVYLVDVPKGAQTEFRIGYSTGLTYNPTGDYYKAALTNYALGGDFNSRLNLNLREDKGWTYGASSRFIGDKYSGEFEFSSGIKAGATDSALAETMKEVRNYFQNGPTSEEISFTRNAIGQSDALRYETGMQKAMFIRRILDYNLPANYVDQQNKILKTITREEMKALAARYLNPDKMNILLVGDKTTILNGVKKLGYEVVELDADGNKVEKKAF